LLYFLENWFYIINRIMAPAGEVSAWLGRVRHDLVKRLVWPARDRRDMGGVPEPGELTPELVDDEGRPATAAAVWRTLADDAPAEAGVEALQDFSAALARAQAAAAGSDVTGVIALEAAYDELARALERGSQGER
jgi:hypothetical protein